jgi:hypothetical protein
MAPSKHSAEASMPPASSAVAMFGGTTVAEGLEAVGAAPRATSHASSGGTTASARHAPEIP